MVRITELGIKSVSYCYTIYSQTLMACWFKLKSNFSEESTTGRHKQVNSQVGF